MEIDLEAFAMFAGTKDPHEEYEYCCPAECPIAQFIRRDLGEDARVLVDSQEVVVFREDRWEPVASVPGHLNNVLKDEVRTWGALATRLEEAYL